MGVHGLTTYVNARSDLLLKDYELKNTLLVIDGNSLTHHLYKIERQQEGCNDFFGGEYDKYGLVIRNFFQVLSHCNITPIIVFNGARDKCRFKTGIWEMQRKIKIVENSTENSSECVYKPLLVKTIFLQTVLHLNIQCVRCTYDADNEIADLAKALQCPILSNDSDFFIFDVPYIPLAYFDVTRQMRYNMQTKSLESFIKCKMYKVDDFVNFSGIKKVNLPVLAMLLGNDYNDSELFSPLFDILKVPKYGTYSGNRQQKKIELVVSWLKDENYDSAVKTILNCFEEVENQTDIQEKIAKSSHSYAIKKSEIMNYLLDLDDINLKEINSTFNEIRIINDGDNKKRPISGNDDSSKNTTILSHLPPQFISNYRKCKLPSHFMTLITLNKHCIRPQFEDFSEENALNIGLPILKDIYRILTSDLPGSGQLRIYSKNEHSNGIKNYQLEKTEQDVPSLKLIYELSSLERKEKILKLLNINQAVIENLQSFPTKWHLILITFDYWTRNSNVEDCFVYAIVLCGILLSYVDKNIHKQQLYRTREDFCSRYDTEISKECQGDNVSLRNITSCMEDINYVDSILCMNELISYFETDIKNDGNIFDLSIVHQLALFQSCLLRISHLNDLFNKPIDNILFSEFYNGTFLYNLLTSLKKVEKKDLKNHLKLLLKNCPKIASILEVMVDSVIIPNQAVDECHRI